MVAEDDWRLLNAKRTLDGATFRLKEYRAPRPDWDHDHCTGCWAKFAEIDAPDILHQGYAVTGDHKHGEDYEWVCVECFDALKDQLNWKVTK
jgi:hypothetical protein